MIDLAGLSDKELEILRCDLQTEQHKRQLSPLVPVKVPCGKCGKDIDENTAFKLQIGMQTLRYCHPCAKKLGCSFA